MTLDARSPLSILDAACLAAERGLFVTPVWRAANGVCTCPRGADCISPGKHPVLLEWQATASTDFSVLRDWFATDTRNVGVVCSASGICVIDIDPRNGGQDTFDVLVKDLGELPATVAADSGGGGTHYVFRRPTGDLISKINPGIDILRDGRQFLVEPSVHASGGVYRWKPGLGPDEIAIADLPDAWVKRLQRPAPPKTWTPPPISTDAKVERARRYLAKIPGAVAGDNGHTQTFNAVAHVMQGFDLDPDTTYSLIASDYNPRCDPPWSEKDLHHKIRSVAETCKRPKGYLLENDRRPVHTTEQAADRAPDVTEEVEQINWREKLIFGAKGVIKRGYNNVLAFVRYFPDYRGRWSLNTMTGDVWYDGAPMRDTLVHDIRAHADRTLGFSPGRDDVDAAILTSAQDRPFHPIQQYLRSVDWDGVPRLSAMARDYFASDLPLHAELVRKWMVSAVARALNPGCKVDTALMLYGEQGYYKSSFFAILGGVWHADSPIDIANKDSFQQIHAAWIYEFAELENVVTGRAESRLKAWLTSTHDMFRAPYARVVTRKARSCVICGTTNRKQFLTDDTGSRRFLIIPVASPIPRELLLEMRDQLWAEAVNAYEAGETWWLGREAEAEREALNEDYQSEDPWSEPIGEWLAAPTVREITMTDILGLVLKLDVARQDLFAQRRAARVLNQMGWRRKREPDGLRRWRYVRPTANESVPLQTSFNGTY